MCEHKEFEANVHIDRLVDGDLISFIANIMVTCKQCGKPMVFIGLPPGISASQPTVSFNKSTVRLPIVPMAHELDNERPAQALTYTEQPNSNGI